MFKITVIEAKIKTKRIFVEFEKGNFNIIYSLTQSNINLKAASLWKQLRNYRLEQQ